jgi:sodium/potassium-transporting ATPase subunit beta
VSIIIAQIISFISLFSLSLFPARIFLFYLIFYAALALFFVAMWFVFSSSLSNIKPKYELKESIIGTNPGLGFRPMPPESNVESTLIWYQKSNSKNSEYWVSEIEKFLEGEKELLKS